jgi:molecular chaperone DnaK (HSP70)
MSEANETEWKIYGISYNTIDQLRKVLSVNTDAPVSAEYSMEDVDFNHTLRREEYETLIQPVL